MRDHASRAVIGWCVEHKVCAAEMHFMNGCPWLSMRALCYTPIAYTMNPGNPELAMCVKMQGGEWGKGRIGFRVQCIDGSWNAQ